MIASWMLYALAIGMLCTVAAFAAERVLVATGRPVRFAWGAALIVSTAWPLAPLIARLLPTPMKAVTVLPFTIVVQTPSALSADEAAALARALFVDRLLIGVWLVLSLFLFVRLVRGAIALTTTRRGWKSGRVNGVRVQVSENVGPAVVGLRAMDVVVPEWIFSLDESLRAIVLRHEEEHRQARDPYLLFGATVLVALLPWNIALWLQARRLRLAIEMDCDARVLRAHPSPERYGMLILTIAQRKATAPALFAPMLSEPNTNLERRIRAMRATKRLAKMTAVGGGLVAAGMLVLATSLQSASTSFRTPPQVAQRLASAANHMLAIVPETIPVKKPAARSAADSAAQARAADVARSRGQTVRQLGTVSVMARPTDAAVAQPAPRYPDLLRTAGIEGAVIARFSYDSRGMIDPATVEFKTSTHDLLSQAVRNVLGYWRGTPNTSTQVPFVFVLANKTGKDLSSYPGGLPAGAMVIVGQEPKPGEAVDAEDVTRPKEVNANTTFFEFQVEKSVSAMPGNPGARYPDELREAKVEGEVLSQFVVDADGHADLSTFKVLKTTHDLFTEAVVKALPNMKFYPAQVGGRPVKQLVQMPFQFNLAKDK